MPDHPRKQRRARSRSPSLDPPRRATIKDLSEEAIDLVCAFVRDEDDAEAAISTLCSLIRTARLFYSPAKRALLYDPTRALSNWPRGWYWPRVRSLMDQLLREPALGGHVKRLDSLPDQLESDISDVNYANWIFAVGLFCPSIFSLAVPIPYGNCAASAFRDLAGKLKLRRLVLRLADDYDLAGTGLILHECQDFLAGWDLSRCESLQLPPVDVRSLNPPNRPPILIQSASLILQDFRNVTNARVLGDYFDLRNVRSVEYRISSPYDTDLSLSILHALTPELDKMTICGDVDLWPFLSWDPLSRSRFPCLTQLTLGGFDLKGGDLVDIVHQFPLLRLLDFTHSVWTADFSTARVWPESLRYLRHLRALWTGTFRCETVGAHERLQDAITGYCKCNNISLICTADLDLCVWYVDYSEDEYNANKSEEQQDSSEDAEDGIEDVEEAGDDNDSADSDWVRTVSVADPDMPDYERFDRDGIAWSWVFDAHGRPKAVPDDVAFHTPAAASAGDPTLSDVEDDIVAEACIQYLPPLPDEPRLEDGYQAHDDSDGNDFGPEPWLTWSEFCDFESADRAWVRFDIDEDGKEIGWIVGEFSEEESEDDELVSEEDCLVSSIC